jgi:diguanylate cyclase (GGDEF)-like protein
MGEGLCMFDGEKRLVVCNDRYAKIYGLPQDLLKPGTPHRAIIRHRVLSGTLKGERSHRAAEKAVATLQALPDREVSSRIEELSDGRLIRVTRQPMTSGGFVATHLDVTEQQHTAAKIAHMAQHDALTGLPNRVLLSEHLDRALAAVREDGRKLAVLMLDLDRFKDINDTLGHPVGDRLLKAVAARLCSCLHEGDIIARLGGDEFAIVQEINESNAEADALARKIRKACAQPFDLDDHQVNTGTSIGVAIAPEHGSHSDEILKSADLALYRAKTAGRGTHRFFEPELDRLMQSRRALERDLRGALAKGEFELHYQPFANLKTGEITGCEALLRWRHPERGLVAPSEFIGLAEDTGLIVPIGEWVLRTACSEAARWPSGLKIAVNLSVAQFKSQDLLPAVISALAASGVAPSRLELEVTESLVMHDSELVFAMLGRLRELGVRIALDDFGTGYSSLSFLRKFPFDKIKIDRSFVGELRHVNEEARAVARAVVRFAVSLGKTTTAEGVETSDQFEALSAANCTEMQGFYFCRPKPASEIVPMLRSRVEKAVSAA